MSTWAELVRKDESNEKLQPQAIATDNAENLVDADVYDCIDERLELKARSEKTSLCAKKRTGVKAAVLMATPSPARLVTSFFAACVPHFHLQRGATLCREWP